MTDLKCAACGLPGHRYGRNEGMERFDPMACINQLRGLLANGERVEPDYEAAIEAFYRGATPPYGFSADVRRAVDAAVGGRLLVDPPKEERT